MGVEGMAVVGFALLMAFLVLGVPHSLTDSYSSDIFHRYPLSARKNLEGGHVKVPLHIYDSDVLAIGCAADANALQVLLSDSTTLFPVRSTDYRGFVVIWIMNHTNTSIGPFQEVMFTVLTSQEQMEIMYSNSYTVFQLLLADPAVKSFVHSTWTNSTAASEYSRKLLGFNSNEASMNIVSNGMKEFQVRDNRRKEIVMEGGVKEDTRTWMQLIQLPSLLSSFGKKMVELLWANHLDLVFVGMSGIVDGFHKHSPMMQTVIDLDLVKFEPSFGTFDASDNLSVLWPEYFSLLLKPEAIMYQRNMKMVRLGPFNAADAPIGRDVPNYFGADVLKLL